VASFLTLKIRSSAECFLLSHDERVRLFEIAAENKNKIKLIVHVGEISTDEAIEYGLKAKKLGYNAIAATAPYYYKFSQKEITQYYYEIYESVKMPIILYNFPGNIGVEFDLKNKDIRELFKSPAIDVGVSRKPFSELDMVQKKYIEETLKLNLVN